MTEIAKIYDPSLTEDKWYQQWLNNKCFASTPDDRTPFTIVIPPPNVTGVLHMGHMLNNTIQDVLVRKARMEGKNACWVPGTDHASIATEAKVVHMLREKGIKKSDLTRDQFLQHAYEWKDKYGGIILEQLKKLGASCDWDRTDFTMNDHYTDAVINVFIDLYNKGLIYRGLRMVNWDPVGKTALSDEEVLHTTENSKLYYVKYKVADSNEFITIATTRPETILADTAICVNPNDDRFKHLHGKKAIVPFVNREISVITDDYVAMDFGTGCLKVTPAHDANDYALGQKHELEVIDILNEDGTLNEKATLYIGQDRFVVRKQIAKDLEEAGHIAKIEDYQNQVGRSERTQAIIEPRLSLQWFVDMKKFVERNPQVVSDVMEDQIKFHPPKFKNTYKHWMDNIKDWCISRQLWWGQRIPAWYNANGEYVVCKTEAEAIQAFEAKGISTDGVRQEEDVVDTWFSSWLWPLEVFGWNKDKDNKELNYYYPTNDLVTAPEIMFFWVMRMIMAGYEYKGEKPFSNVYFTGIVRDKQGRKMSKQFGNSPDPLDLITKFSADGVRVGMLLSSPAGNDLLFDESLCEQGRNFANKVWNAFRLVKGWEVDEKVTASEGNKQAIAWFESRFNEVLNEVNDQYSKFRMNEALHATYKLVWDDFCAWYLEMIKPEFVDGVSKPIDGETYRATIQFFESILKLMHPFMPFITEEIWHLIADRKDNDFIMLSAWPKIGNIDAELLNKFSNSESLIVEIRNFRSSKGISPKEKLDLFAKGELSGLMMPIVTKLGNLNNVELISNKVENSYGFIQNNIEYYIPFTDSIDVKVELERIAKEIDYNKGFLKSVMAKLGNEKFVANAKPEVVAIEQKKKDDAEAKIKALEEQMASLSK